MIFYNANTHTHSHTRKWKIYINEKKMTANLEKWNIKFFIFSAIVSTTIEIKKIIRRSKKVYIVKGK